MEVEKPIEITASPIPAQVMAAVRVLLTGSGMSLATYGVNKGILASDAFSRTDVDIIVGAAITVGVFVWSQISTRLAHKKAVITARAAPDKVAVVKE